MKMRSLLILILASIIAYIIGVWAKSYLPDWMLEVIPYVALGWMSFIVGRGSGRGAEYRRFMDYMDCLRGEKPEALESELAQIEVFKPEEGWANDYGISWHTIDGYWWRQPPSI
tara:strand:+ start:1188 stop:1529 length:342 start_codon:yes stop_codon:yes gene_type:complete